MVPLQDVALAAAELARLKRDGFAGVEIGSNVDGAMLGDPRFDEFYAEAERLDLAIFVHALHPIGVERLAEGLHAMGDLVPFALFPLDTALTAITLMRAGVLERYPRLKIGFSHGGGAIVPLTHRLAQGWKLTGGFGGAMPQPPAYYAQRFFYDSLVYDPVYLRHLTREFAPGQVFGGTDYPYAIMETGLRAFLQSAEGDPDVMHATARRFLGLRARS
jgi:aminocarboxymuconate-semialdehyde decarboxylase